VGIKHVTVTKEFEEFRKKIPRPWDQREMGE
jgi:hypothetical protein